MKEKVGRLAKGIFEYEMPKLIVSTEQLFFEVEEGQVYEGSFQISNSEDVYMKGIIYTSNSALRLENTTFAAHSVTIQFTYHTSDATIEKQKGTISIVSSCGEVMIPFQVKIQTPYFMTSLGRVNDLFQFTNLAKSDWAEAMKIFCSSRFLQVFRRDMKRYESLYKSLLRSVSTSQAMEEFLIAIHKKESIQLSPNRMKFHYEEMTETIQDKVILSKEQWGHAEYKITSSAEFVVPEHNYIWSDKFLRNQYELKFVVNKEKLKHGVNKAILSISSIKQSMELEIIATKQEEEKERKKTNQYKVALTTNYLAFRLNQIDRNQYEKNGRDILFQLSGIESATVILLLQGHIEYVSGRMKQLEKIIQELELQKNEILEESILFYSGFLYLKALYTKTEDDIKEAVQTIQSYYVGECRNWLMLWFLFYLDKKYDRQAQLKLSEIKGLFEEGAHTPVLYYEASVIYNNNPELLRELGPFEQAVLHFSIRNDMVSSNVCMQYVSLVNRMKGYKMLLVNDLMTLYESYPQEDVLSAIIRMLIKGHKDQNRYFRWYELGVMNKLKITELYEYYMYSIDESLDVALPQPILIYFIYNSSLSDTKRAFLFAHIIKNKEKLTSVYQTYFSQIQLFARKQIQKKRISKTLAVIYEDVLTEQFIDQEIAFVLPAILFKYELTCNNKRIVKVIVNYKELKDEYEAILVGGKAQINLYSDTATIFLVDEGGNRYLQADYTIEKLMKEEPYIQACFAQNKYDPFLLLYMEHKIKHYNKQESELITIQASLLESNAISDEFKQTGYVDLIEYYYNGKDGDKLERYLKELNLSNIDGEKRHIAIEYLIMRGLYTKALEAVLQYGYEKVDKKRLARLVDKVISKELYIAQEEKFLAICYELFEQAKADAVILNYLVEYYCGQTEKMYELWKVAKEANLDTVSLEDRLLGQMLFSESEIHHSFLVFQSYYRKGRDRILIRGYLSYYGYKYLLNDRVVNDELFVIMKKESFYENNRVCMLALLKYYSKCDAITEQEREFIEYNVNQFIEQGLILPFFKQLRKKVSIPQSVSDKYYVQYITNPKNKVTIHYVISSEDKENVEEYTKEVMPDVFEGIFVKSFVLFYNETLSYYITEEGSQGINVTESTIVSLDNQPSEGDTTYDELNLMLITKELQDEVTLLELMKNYVKKSYVVTELFQPLQ